MKLPGLGIPMQDKVPAYMALGFFLLMLAMIVFFITFAVVVIIWIAREGIFNKSSITNEAS